MTISMTAGFTTGTLLHGTIKASPWEYSRAVQTFFAVTGEYHLQGRSHGRNLEAWLQLSQYATHALLNTGIETINAFISDYNSLTWAVGADTKTFTNVVFDGFEPSEDPWNDGSGVNGWICQGTLKFRQIKQ